MLTGAGTLAWYQGDVANSRQMCEQAARLAREIGDREAEAYQLGNLAVHATELGDHERASAWYEASLAVAREAGRTGATARAASAALGVVGSRERALGDLGHERDGVTREIQAVIGHRRQRVVADRRVVDQIRAKHHGQRRKEPPSAP